MDRKQQQAEVIYKLGLLFRPLQDLVDFPDQQTPQTRARASAKFEHDRHPFRMEFEKFTRGEAGHIYGVEYANVANELSAFGDAVGRERDEQGKLRISLNLARQAILAAITAIPTEVDSQVLEARSPFQAYCKLKAFFETTANRVTWADPFMGSGLFHRYLNGLPDSMEVVLVTQERGGKPEYQDFLNISRLYAAERGPTKYRLIVESTQHDRWLRCDDQMYLLGGSAKDAGRRSDFTISKMESTQANFQKLDQLIANGRELFGPATPAHT